MVRNRLRLQRLGTARLSLKRLLSAKADAKPVLDFVPALRALAFGLNLVFFFFILLVLYSSHSLLLHSRHALAPHLLTHGTAYRTRPRALVSILPVTLEIDGSFSVGAGSSITFMSEQLFSFLIATTTVSLSPDEAACTTRAGATTLYFAGPKQHVTERDLDSTRDHLRPKLTYMGRELSHVKTPIQTPLSDFILRNRPELLAKNL
ncbi:hypothetical protein B0H17DRAFT_541355 [Mycena rosella]|uniref:Uncharacterized protein n=1 Tax=Mycena rosella TaxID=1033263 RepID=A0AAD7GFN7_MYCRO|nr:hypothetical protein B0H17DRAFT_541355 [Mycena rosella]